MIAGVAPGDPTTPGYPSKPGVPRQEVGHAIPSIPSVPISYTDALPILKALNGHGPKALDFNKYWQGGGLGYKGVEYYSGPSPADLVLNLVNEQDYITTPMWNVIGVINGTLPDEVVVLGNHRDAWVAGGAGDPNSGSAAMNEVVRSFGTALAKGWKPLRTIVFASWDGEEYGLIGSTEWVEEYLPWLSKSAIAYLNVDVGTRGPQFSASASPLLNKALYEATSLVQSPNQTIKGQTVRDLWNGRIGTMGSGSDFTAFQDFAGIPSVDLGFGPSANSAVYHYHSNYDSFAWMDNFGDPEWHYHVAITKVWALFAASLIENPVLHLNATDYATGLASYLDSVKKTATDSAHPSMQSLSFPLLDRAISSFHTTATTFDAHAASLAASIDERVPWWKWWQKVKLYYEVRNVNDKYKYLERQFLHPEGLDGRTWFKHVVFAPGIWTGYAGATFPGMTESIERGDRAGIDVSF
jgi:N-acetylated-alpha-linked acidic dipeptidase